MTHRRVTRTRGALSKARRREEAIARQAESKQRFAELVREQRAIEAHERRLAGILSDDEE